MPDPLAVLLGLPGGLGTTAQLREGRVPRRALAAAVEAQRITRVRRGWFAAPSAHPDVVRAVRAGGALTCVSEAARRGVWRPPGDAMHISVLPTDRHVRDPDTGESLTSGAPGLVMHWSSRRPLAETGGRAPWREALAEVMRCAPRDMAVAVLESALQRREAVRADLRAAASSVSAEWQSVVAELRSDAESGSESLFRIRLASHGVEMTPQVVIPGIGRVDFVIGDRLVVEIDSDAHHGGRNQRIRDLRRDAAAAGLGFIVLRFDYSQVLHDWESVESAVLAIVARGDHFARREPGEFRPRV